jgi:hypothetical protein
MTADFTGSEAALTGLAALAASQKTYASLYESALRKMLSDLTNKGSATLYWGAEPPPADAVQVTVSKTDIANLVAYNANLLQQAPALPVSASSRTMPGSRLAAPERDANFLNCLVARPPYTIIPLCKKLKAGQFLAGLVQDYLGLLDQNAILGEVQSRSANGIQQILRKGTSGAVMNKLKGWLRGLEIACLVEPITLEGSMSNRSSFRTGRRARPRPPVCSPI